MGKKLDKKDILETIEKEIEQCKAFQEDDPDKGAEERVKSLNANPVALGKFFVNITLKNAEIANVTKLSERIKRLEDKDRLMTVKEINALYKAGCIITVNIMKEKDSFTFSINASSIGSYSSMMDELINKYYDNSNELMLLKPKKPVIGNNYIENDLKAAFTAGKKRIIYALANFDKSIKTIDANILLKTGDELYDNTTHDVYSVDFDDMQEASYVNMSRNTSIEQNVNEFLGAAVLDSVTMRSSKSGVVMNYDLSRTYGVYDMCGFFLTKINEIKLSDDAISNERYKFYSEVRDDVFLSQSEAKFKAFKNFGGAWTDWASAEAQFLTCKSVYGIDKEFTEKAKNNGAFMNSILAAEKTFSLYSNTTFDAIDASWKIETDYFKKKPPSDITCTNIPEKDTTGAEGKAKAFVAANCVAPPTFKIVPHGSTRIKFEEKKKYYFCVPVSLGMTKEKYAELKSTNGDSSVCEPYEILGDQSTQYGKVTGHFTSTNEKEEPRDVIKVNGINYNFTKSTIKLDKDIHQPYTDEIENKHMLYEVPENSYYNSVERVFFKADSLDDRFKQITLSYRIIPKVVKLPYTFIQDSSYETLTQANDRLETVKKDYEGKYKRLCVDTINYDPWEVSIKKLKKLIGKYAIIPAIEQKIELMPFDSLEDRDEICEKCKQEKKDCTCNRLKLCSKSYPLNFYGMSNAKEFDDSDTMSLCSLTYCIYDTAGHAMTLAEIAKAAYETIFKEQGQIPAEKFETKSQYAMAVLGITYSSLSNSPDIQITGSLANRMTENKWEKFKLDYMNSLYEEGGNPTREFSVTMKAGLADGFSYFPTGHEIAFELDLATKSFTVKGATTAQMAAMMPLVAMDEETYMASWRSIAEICAPLSEDMKKFIAYPYMPNYDTIMNGSPDNDMKTMAFDEITEEYVYMPNTGDITHAGSFKGTKVLVRFDIYIKTPVPCAYPREKLPACRNDYSYGFCGLRELYEKPLIAYPYGFELEQEVAYRTVRKHQREMRKIALKLIDDTRTAAEAACNVSKNLQKIDSICSRSRKELIDYINENSSQMATVNGTKKAFVAALKAIMLQSIMVDYDRVFNHTAKSIEVMCDDSFGCSKRHIAEIFKDFRTLPMSRIDALDENVKAYRAFSMCNKLFSDYMTEDGLPKSIDSGLLESSNAENVGVVLVKIAYEFTADAIMIKINERHPELSKFRKEELVKAIRSCDLDMIKVITKCDDPIEEIAVIGDIPSDKVSALDCIKKGIVAIFDKIKAMKSVKEKVSAVKNLTKALDVVNDVTSVTSSLASNVTSGIEDGVKNAVKKAIESVMNISSKDKKDESSEKMDKLKSAITTAKNAASSAASKAKDTISSAAEKVSSSSTTEKAKEAMAGIIQSNSVSTITDIIKNNVTNGMEGLSEAAGKLGVGAGLTKKDTVSSCVEGATGAVNNALKKVDLKETLNKILAPLTSSDEASSKNGNSVITQTEVSMIVNEINDTLSDEIASGVSEKVSATVESGVGAKLDSMSKTIEENKVLDEIVSAVTTPVEGELTDSLTASVNGSSKSANNSEDSEKALDKVNKFINYMAKEYQKITDETISFDSV